MVIRKSFKNLEENVIKYTFSIVMYCFLKFHRCLNMVFPFLKNLSVLFFIYLLVFVICSLLVITHII